MTPEAVTQEEPDVRVERGDPSPWCSVFLFHPLTCAATDWIEENVVGETQWIGAALAVETRHAQDLALGMVAGGLRVV